MSASETDRVSHTAGPWTTHPNDPWAVYGMKEGREITVCDVRHAGSQISEANARLIAAAPELLEAARLWLAFAAKTPPAVDLTDEWTSVIDTTVSAIAKAEGREP